MGDRITEDLKGLAFLDPDYGVDSLSASETTATEADPRPGSSSTSDALARAEPQVLGAQAKEVTFVGTRAAGMPGIGAKGGGVGYYLHNDSETVADTRHHRPPFTITNARNFGSGRAESTSIVAFPLSGKVLAAPHVDDGLRKQLWLWDPETSLWTITSFSPVERGAMVIVPGTERVLWVYERGSTYYSDDHGTTWEKLGDFDEFGDGVYEYDDQPRSLAFDGAGQLLWAGIRDDGSNNLDLFVSGDSGVSWERTATIADAKYVSLASHPAGTIGLAYSDTSDDLKFILLGGASDNPAFAVEVTIDDSAREANDVALVADEDGSFWVYYWMTLSSGASNLYMIWSASFDQGTTWEAPSADADRTITNWDCNDTSGDDHPAGMSAAASMGRVFLMIGTRSSSNDYVNGVLELGGWQGHLLEMGGVVGSAANLFARNPIYRLANSAGATGASTARAHMWLPFATGDVLSGANFTQTIAGTATETISADGGWTIKAVNTFDELNYSQTFSATGGDEDCVIRGGLRVIDDAAGVGGGDEIRIEVVGDTHSFWLIFRDDEVVVYDDDDNAEIGAAISYTANGFVRFECLYDDSAGTVDLLIHDVAASPISTKWTYNQRTLTGSHASTGTTVIQWGMAVAQGDTEVTWYYHMALATPNSTAGKLPIYQNGRDGWGKPVPGLYSYPIPELYDTANDRVSRVAMRGGPLLRHETYTHDTAPDRPVENVFPVVQSSPKAVWRSVDKSANQDIAINLDTSYDRLVAGSMVWLICVQNANFRRLAVQAKSIAAGSFATLATLDLAAGFDACSYALNGDTLSPNDPYTGTAGARYIWPGELRGGHVILDPSGTPKVRRIKFNTGGLWSSDSMRAHIYLEGLDGTEAASGTVQIVWPSGVLAIHATDLTAATAALKFRVASTELSPDAYYEAGIIAPFGLHPAGRRWSDGWEWGQSPNARADVDSARAEKRRSLGPVQRNLVLSWDDGYKLERLRSQSSPDYVASSSADYPLVARDEVWQAAWEWMRLSDSFARPVLWCGKVPANGETLTDPTLWMMGYLKLQPVRGRQATGEEGVDEFMRTSGIEIVEAV